MGSKIKKANYNERKKIEKGFYRYLLFVFSITMLAGACVLGFLWMWLTKYEMATPEGSMNIYFDNIQAGNYEKLYEESKEVFYQLNDYETYANYLENKYQGYDLDKVGYIKLAYSNHEYSYYDVVINGDYISTLQIKQAEDKKRYYVRTNMNDYSFTVEYFNEPTDVYINDVKINDAFLAAQDIESNLTEGTNYPEPPMVDRYFFDNIIDTPTVTTSDPNSVVVNDLGGSAFYVGNKPSPENLAEYEELIKNAAMTYCKYITRDAMYYQIRQLLLPNTVFADALSTFENTWFTAHDSISFENVEVFEVMEFEDGFIGSIKFDYIVEAHDVSQTYSSIYQLTFKEQNGRYLVSNLKIGDQ
ncbi:MAG: hypothetical protein SPH32_06840 [Erysipelotrichaceae bacterium]|nr:hypothetical protein [Erysipelotrichaceae bacterium]